MGKSARIQRRNKYGFNGEGSHKTFKKVTCNIKDYNVTIDNKTYEAKVKQAKAKAFKHPGSKPLYLLNLISRKNLTSSTYSALNYLKRLVVNERV